MSKRILVPLDGRPFAEAAIPSAVHLAKRDGAEIQLAIVWQPLPPAAESSPWIKELQAWEEQTRRQDRRYLTAIASKVGDMVGRSVTVKYLLGKPAEELSDWAAEWGADVVVTSTHGSGPVSRAWLGSVADRMVRKGAVPILLVRPDPSGPPAELTSATPIRKIVVPLDGSPVAETALQKDVLLGSAGENVEITLLHIIGYPIPLMTPEGSVQSASGLAHEAQVKASDAYLARVAERMASWGCRVTPLTVLEASPWTGIADFAASNGMDLIAMSTHGRGGAARLVLGSVADRVMRISSVPTLLFPPERNRRKRIERQMAEAAMVSWP